MQTKLLSILKYQNSRIARYIIRNLFIFFFAIIFIISLVVFGNQFVLMVQESIGRGIPLQELMPLVIFNMIRDLPLILTLSLFLMRESSRPAVRIRIPRLPTPSLIDLGMSEKLETGSYVYLIAGGLPLLVYPLIFLTFMMNMGIPRTGDESIWALLISTTFQSVSLAYPFVYVPSLLGAMSAAKHKDEKKERLSP